MFDLLARAWRHPMDYIGALRCHILILQERRHEGDNIYTFIFAMKKPFNWKAGQHGIFTLLGKKIKGRVWRPFSIASSPQEGVVQIGTVIPPKPSDFKAQLMSLEIGDQIKVRGPFGEFHAHHGKKHMVGIAGGIGITPFRSLAYEIAHGHLPETSLTLIYSAAEKHAYRNELDAWQNDRLRIIYTNTPEEVEEMILNQWNLYGNDADYYISGSPKMIAVLRLYCQQLGIQNIINDPFKGY